METTLMQQIMWGLGGALLGALIFSAVGLIAGTSETATVGKYIISGLFRISSSLYLYVLYWRSGGKTLDPLHSDCLVRCAW